MSRMPSPSPGMTIAGEPPQSPAVSSTKPAAALPKVPEAAKAAFQRSVGRHAELPLSEGAGGPAREGLTRLRGAFAIEVARIRPDPNQPRREFKEDELSQLSASVAERGIKQPVRVWFVEAEGVYQIISGERRYRAAIAVGLAIVPCIIEDAPTGSVLPRREILVDQVVENWQRADLNPYDLSDALKELRDRHGLKQEEIARLTGKPKSEISRFLAMQRVAPDVQATVRKDQEGRFSRRHVVALSKLTPEEQQAVVERIKTEKLSAVETERAVHRLKKQGDGKAIRGAPVSVRRYAIGSTQVKITFRKRAVSRADLLTVIDQLREMVERE